MAEHIAIKNVSLFNQVPEEIQDRINIALKQRALKKGDVIFDMGDKGDELIIVESGKVSIYAPEKDKPAEGQSIRVFMPGEVLGEMALIDSKPRSLSARAEEDTIILTLGRGDFESIIGESPVFGVSVMASLSDRIRYTTDFLNEVKDWVRKVAEGNYEVSQYTPKEDIEDENLSVLAEAFARMAAKVKEREEELKQEVAQLRIVIDETKRKQEANTIMNSDYYKDLKSKIKQMREENKGEE